MLQTFEWVLSEWKETAAVGRKGNGQRKIPGYSMWQSPVENREREKTHTKGGE